MSIRRLSTQRGLNMNSVIGVVLSKYDDIFDIFARSYLAKVDADLVVVDDGLSRSIKGRYPVFNYVPAPRPFAFCMSVNAGIRIQPDKDILLMNDDVVFQTQNFASCLSKEAYKDDKIGLIAPMMNNVQNREQYPENRIAGDVRITEKPISFTIVYIKRSAIDDIGLLDEEYRHGIGEREDVDYCLRLQQAGYKLAIAQNCMAFHGGEIFGRKHSITRMRAGQFDKVWINKEYFRKKWGHD